MHDGVDKYRKQSKTTAILVRRLYDSKDVEGTRGQRSEADALPPDASEVHHAPDNCVLADHSQEAPNCARLCCMPTSDVGHACPRTHS